MPRLRARFARDLRLVISALFVKGGHLSILRSMFVHPTWRYILFFYCSLASASRGYIHSCTHLRHLSVFSSALLGFSMVHPVHCLRSSSHCLSGWPRPLLPSALPSISTFIVAYFLVWRSQCFTSLLFMMSTTDSGLSPNTSVKFSHTDVLDYVPYPICHSLWY